MKVLKVLGIALIAGSILFGETACSSMTQTGKGALIGGGGGAAVGAGLGALIGGGKGAGIGSAIGAAVGAGAGALIGNKMDKQKKELQQQLGDQAKVEETTDQNGLKAIKVTFDGGILFPTGKYQLSPAADATLSRIAYNLKQFPESDITVVGYTDNTGSQQVNDKLSQQRAESVVDYLEQQGVAADRLKAIGKGWDDPIASNSTAAGRAQNRRVEIYITANQQAIANAEKQSGGN